MEIYANIIEYGPDLYGIAPAARRFFGKDPADLSINESAYIATLLPNPKARYIYYCQNHLSENFGGLVSANIQKMYEQNMISSAEMDRALKEHLRFAAPLLPADTVDCPRNIVSFEKLEQESLRAEF